MRTYFPSGKKESRQTKTITGLRPGVGGPSSTLAAIRTAKFRLGREREDAPTQNAQSCPSRKSCQKNPWCSFEYFVDQLQKSIILPHVKKLLIVSHANSIARGNTAVLSIGAVTARHLKRQGSTGPHAPPATGVSGHGRMDFRIGDLGGGLAAKFGVATQGLRPGLWSFALKGLGGRAVGKISMKLGSALFRSAQASPP